MKSKILHILSLYILAICTILTSCKEDELLMAESVEDGDLFVRCASADFIVTTTGRNAVAETNESTINNLDLLVYKKDGTLLRHLDIKSDADSLTFESNIYTWNISGQIPKSYVKNTDYSICLIGNYLGSAATDFPTLNDLKAYRFNGSMDSEPTYPYEANYIPMVQLQESGTLKNFDEYTQTLRMESLERVMAKIEILPDIPETISSINQIIEEYRLINYTNSYTLFNTNDSDKDTTNLKVYPGLTTLPSTGFKTYTETTNMWGNNNLVLYAYPNNWFDSDYYNITGYDGPHKEEPINYGRQTYVLAKSRYITNNDEISSKAYYYKIPINYRLPEFNDAVSNGTTVDHICKTIYNTIYAALLDNNTIAATNISDKEKAAIIEDFKMGFYGRTLPTDIDTRLNAIYSEFTTAYSDNKINNDEKESISEVILQQLYDGTADTKEEVYTIIKETARKEAEQYCRIQRNHHYKIHVRFDKPGGEGADEAVYLFAEPYADVIIRPEF